MRIRSSGRVPACLVLTAALGWAAPSYGDGDILQRQDNNTFYNPTTVKITGGGTNALPPSGAFSDVRATTTDSNGKPKTDDKAAKGPLPYDVTKTYDSTKAHSGGFLFTADSEVVATTKTLKAATDGPPKTPATVEWTANANPFHIEPVKNPPKDLSETATATWHVSDPVLLHVLPGDHVGVSVELSGGLGMIFPTVDPKSMFLGSKFTASAGTDLPEYTDLYFLSIGLTNAAQGAAVQFTSNPLLGLNDAAIASDLAGRFAYDASTGNYGFAPTGLSLGASLTVPAGVSQVTVSTSLGDELDAAATGVPEPSPLALAGLAASLWSAIRWWRRRRRTPTNA
jgi:hypothetical protein